MSEGGSPPGPLAGLRVLELSSQYNALTGKLLADAGAEVILIEPPGGDPSRAYAPFEHDAPGAGRGLWFWYYNTSKQGITLSLDDERGRDLFRRLVAGMDVLIESEPPGRLAALGLDFADLQALGPGLIMVSVTPYGRGGPRARDQATDLTIWAGGGPAWSCGYDDHSLPPVRTGGNQGFHTGCHFAVMSLMVALLAREHTGRGQHIDVNMHAAANVTTEAATYTWLVAKQTVQRQTGRHAAVNPTFPTQIRSRDGVWVNTGTPPRTVEGFKRLYKWLGDEGLLEEFHQAPILEHALTRNDLSLAKISTDHEIRAIYSAARDAMILLAERLTAREFFDRGQQHNVQVSIINSPEEVLSDPHFVARGFPVAVEHPESGRAYIYPGAPYRFERTPWRIRRRAPLLGEDNAAVVGALGLTAPELEALSAAELM